MNILYVYAHPNEHSFNNELKDHGLRILNNLNQSIKVSDLYQKNFNPIASWRDFKLAKHALSTQYFLAQLEALKQNVLSDDIQDEINKIKWANHIIFQFPLWWFSMPAILKGWFDRIWVKGFAYDTGKIFDEGLLKGKTASLVISTQSPESAYQRNGVHGASIDTFLHHIHHTLRFVGIQTLDPFVTFGAFNLDDEKENIILNNYQIYLEKLIKHR